MPWDKEKDLIFTDTDLKALLLKSMPPTWQNLYLLKGTQIMGDFQQMLAYFVQFQSITDSQATIRSNPSSTTWDQKKKPVQTMDKVDIFSLLFTVVEVKATGFPGKHI